MTTYEIQDPTTGQIIEVQGDREPTEAELKEIFASVSPEQSTLLTDPVETLKRSGGEFLSDVGELLTTPPQKTLKSVADLATGVVQKAIPGEQSKEFIADAMGQFFVDRYGSLERAKNTFLTDPVGFVADASMFISGGGGALATAGKVAKTGKIARAGQQVARVGQAIDPLAAAMKMAGKGVSKATQAVKIKPFANALDNPVIRAAKNLDIEVPASAKTTSRVAPLAEAAVTKGLFGKKLTKKIIDIQEKMIEIGDDLVTKTRGAQDLGVAGDLVVEGAEKFRRRFIDIKNALYEQAGFNERGVRIQISPQDAAESLDFVNDVLSQKQKAGRVIGKATDSSLFSKIKKALEGETIKQQTSLLDAQGRPLSLPEEVRLVDASELKAALNELNEVVFTSTDPLITGNKGKLKKLSTLLSKELDQAIVRQDPALAKDLERANKFYQLGLNEINSHFGKTIFRLKDQPDKIIPALLKDSTSAQDVKRIYRLIGSENVKNVQGAFLREFLDKAKNVQGTAFTPQGLMRQMNKFGRDKLVKVLGQEQFETLDDLAEVARGMGKTQKIAEGAQTAFTGRLLAQFAPLLGFDLQKTALLLGGDKILSDFITGPVGQRLLAGETALELQGKTGRMIQRGADFIRPVTATSRIIESISQ